jgi:hypothetical protein
MLFCVDSAPLNKPEKHSNKDNKEEKKNIAGGPIDGPTPG